MVRSRFRHCCYTYLGLAGLSVSAATLLADQRSVELSVSPLTLNNNYTVHKDDNNIRL